MKAIIPNRIIDILNLIKSKGYEAYLVGGCVRDYFLGNTPSYRNAVTEVARKLNCKIVALRHLDQYIESDENFGDYAQLPVLLAL